MDRQPKPNPSSAAGSGGGEGRPPPGYEGAAGVSSGEGGRWYCINCRNYVGPVLEGGNRCPICKSAYLCREDYASGSASFSNDAAALARLHQYQNQYPAATAAESGARYVRGRGGMHQQQPYFRGFEAFGVGGMGRGGFIPTPRFGPPPSMNFCYPAMASEFHRFSYMSSGGAAAAIQASSSYYYHPPPVRQPFFTLPNFNTTPRYVMATPGPRRPSHRAPPGFIDFRANKIRPMHQMQNREEGGNDEAASRAPTVTVPEEGSAIGGDVGGAAAAVVPEVSEIAEGSEAEGVEGAAFLVAQDGDGPERIAEINLSGPLSTDISGREDGGGSLDRKIRSSRR